MANNTAGDPLIPLPWAGKRARIEEMDAFLSSLWNMSADNMRTIANVRTSVLNLVICTPDTESAHYANELLRDLSSPHLARATIAILNNDAQAPDVLQSWGILRCFSTASDLSRHCFEQATLLTSGMATRKLGQTLPAVLKAYLPAYLWWIGDITGVDLTVFREVATLCQRVIVDSATFFQPEQDIHTLAAYARQSPDVALSDLNWARLDPWLQLVAQFFDVAEYLPFLAGIEKIEIEHAAAPLAMPSSGVGGTVSLNPTSAFLLGSWLKSRLALELVEGSTHNLYDTGSGSYQWLLNLADEDDEARDVLMQIRPNIQGTQPGSLALVRLTCLHEGRRATFTIERDPGTDNVFTSVDLIGDKRPRRTVNLPVHQDEHELLRKELEVVGHNALFEESMLEVERLLNRGPLTRLLESPF